LERPAIEIVTMTTHFNPFAADKLAQLRRRIDAATEVTPALMREAIEAACGKLMDGRSGAASAIWRLVQTEAYVDAALALVGTALPDWSVRRICRDDGMWWCAMNTSQPVYWDADEVDEAHPVMALAILKAFLAALAQARPSGPWWASFLDPYQLPNATADQSAAA
jgi:hypothetical protein